MVVVELEFELELEDEEGVGASIDAALEVIIIKRSCCRDRMGKRPGLSAAREWNRGVAPPRHFDDDDDTDDDDDGFRGVTGRGPGLGTEPIAHKRTGAANRRHWKLRFG